MPPSTRQAGPSGSSSSRVNGRGEAAGSDMLRSDSNRSRDGGRANVNGSVQRNDRARGRQGVEGDASASQAQTQTQHRYAPKGDPKQKRELRQEYRSLIGSTQERRNNIADARPQDLSNILTQASTLFERVEAPSESVLDSRFLLSASEMGAQMAKSMKVGSDFDVEDYLSRCMRLIGGRLRSMNGPAAREDDNDDEDEEIMSAMPDPDFWHWDKLGRKAAKRTRRAVTMDHLLGPLEVSHTKRNVKRRTGVDKSGPIVNPTQLGASDLVKNANETSTLVKQISSRLEQVGGRDGVNLFRFAIDPHSFANTVENLFYVSFLVREGTASLDTENEADEPIVMCCEPPEASDFEQGVSRRQIVLELDMEVWRELIQLYDIRQPMITIDSRSEHQDANTDTWTAGAGARASGSGRKAVVSSSATLVSD